MYFMLLKSVLVLCPLSAVSLVCKGFLLLAFSGDWSTQVKPDMYQSRSVGVSTNCLVSRSQPLAPRFVKSSNNTEGEPFRARNFLAGSPPLVDTSEPKVSTTL